MYLKKYLNSIIICSSKKGRSSFQIMYMYIKRYLDK